ncbi:hypothetical protein, partial [Legionella drancourtii]|uniref:hypothetical protein n=1 Tax=Legionella drancourtii TaxID=168933 RepID=UPI0011D29E19
MNVIPQQSATAGVSFRYDFKPAGVAFYNENQMSGASVVGEMPQADIDQLAKVGLQFHPDTLIIDGTPKKTDVLTLHVGAKNGYSTAAAIQFTLKIDANLEHTPVFKKHFSIASAAVAEKYTMDLMNLLEKTPGFGETNQISFSIVKDGLNAGWLKISDTNSMLLEGVAHKEDAGKEVQVKLMAHSNTGGNSDPITIYIPVAADPEQKPTINYFEMEQLAGSQFYTDVLTHISSPAKEANPKIILEKIEPKADWLHVSELNPTALEGVIPLDATGQKYLITLRASTIAGGASNAITIPLQISVDNERTPQFKAANPHLPLVYPGQDYFYDFVEHQDVFPEYDDAPYTIEFAENYEPPTWLKLQNNKLFSESLVPDDNSQFKPFSLPSVTLAFYQGAPTTVYSGETLRIPMLIYFEHLRRKKSWTSETNIPVSVENVVGNCPTLPSDELTWHKGHCYMNVVINSRGVNIGTSIQGFVRYHVEGEKDGNYFNCRFPSPYFSVTVIPHPLSMTNIQQQSAKIGQEFIYPLWTAVQYYSESRSANINVNLKISAEEYGKLKDLSLYFEPSDFSIRGKPNKTGTFQFHVGASNVYGGTELTTLGLNVGYNPKDKPRFKQNNEIASAVPDKKYSLNLVNLLENNALFNETNQVTFRFDPNSPKPEGLNINAANLTVLEGSIPKNLAGQVVNATIIATSNTGGDSDESLTIHIPVAADPEQKPTISYFEMKQLAGNQFLIDISNQIQDPANDSELKVIIDKIEPKVTWLNISSLNPKALEGVVPNLATGQKYLITLHANTRTGGNSDSITVPLQINFDPRLTPQFKEDNPHLPMLFPGQPFIYNFVDSRDIFPEYDDAP